MDIITASHLYEWKTYIPIFIDINLKSQLLKSKGPLLASAAMLRRLSSLFEWWPRCEPCGGGVSFRMPRGLIAEDELAFFSEYTVHSDNHNVRILTPLWTHIRKQTQTLTTYAYSPLYEYANHCKYNTVKSWKIRSHRESNTWHQISSHRESNSESQMLLELL